MTFRCFFSFKKVAIGPYQSLESHIYEDHNPPSAIFFDSSIEKIKKNNLIITSFFSCYKVTKEVIQWLCIRNMCLFSTKLMQIVNTRLMHNQIFVGYICSIWLGWAVDILNSFDIYILKFNPELRRSTVCLKYFY